jgi:hypothetical protein
MSHTEKTEACPPIKKNFSKKKKLIKRIGRATGIFAQIISTIVVVLTLMEMKVERDNAYKPDIMMEDSKIQLVWGKKDDINSDEINYEPVDNVSIPLHNVGVGTAKKVQIELKKDSIIEQLDLLKTNIDNFRYEYKETVVGDKDHYDELDVFVNDNKFSYYVRNKYEFNYILSDTQSEQYYEISLQTLLTDILTDIVGCEYITISQSDTIRENFPDTVFIVKYTDIQGVNYSKTINMHYSMLKGRVSEFAGYYDCELIFDEYLQ